MAELGLSIAGAAAAALGSLAGAAAGGAGADAEPFPAFRFALQIDGLARAGFSECTGLQHEMDVLDYPEGGLNTRQHHLPGRTKQSRLTLKHGIVDRSLWDWFWLVAQGDVSLRTGSIVARDQSGASVTMEWRFAGAFPSKWSGPDLNATQNSVAMESLEICHRGLERVR